MGVGTILRAREVVLLAWGRGKAEAVARAVEGEQTGALPASFLQLQNLHLERKDLYEEEGSSSPSFQAVEATRTCVPRLLQQMIPWIILTEGTSLWTHWMFP